MIKINILVKNPKKGGIPAIEKIEIKRTFVKIFVAPKLLNECSVLISIFKNCNKVKNKTQSAKL
jgi:hypothetical protein